MTPRTVRRAAGRALLLLGFIMTFSLCAFFAAAWQTLGTSPSGARLARIERSPQWKNGHFENPQPLWNDVLGALTAIFRSAGNTLPSAPLPVVAVAPDLFKSAPPSGLRITWLGHSTSLIEIDGRRILLDPMFSERASPLSWLGPKRWYAPPLALAALPPLDAVLISHDHYDHLDYATIKALKDRTTRFIVPLGVGAHLEYWGVPAAHIVELDWWERYMLHELEIVATPARHASGRMLPLTIANKTLWAGFALIGPKHRVYYSGDTGLFPGLADIGRRLGPFDAALIETGAYNQAWPDWHLGPEQALTANRLVGGRLLLPVHWGLFRLAYHAWTEPVERVLAAAKESGAWVIVPRPGQSIEPDAAPELVRWWPKLPWVSGAQDPIISTKMGSAADPETR